MDIEGTHADAAARLVAARIVGSVVAVVYIKTDGCGIVQGLVVTVGAEPIDG